MVNLIQLLLKFERDPIIRSKVMALWSYDSGLARPNLLLSLNLFHQSINVFVRSFMYSIHGKFLSSYDKSIPDCLELLIIASLATSPRLLTCRSSLCDCSKLS